MHTLDPITRLQNLQTVLARTLATLKEREEIRRDLDFIELAQRTK